MSISELTAAAGVPSPPQRVHARHHPLFGGLVVKEGLINQAQLDKVLALQQETEPRPLLGQMLLDQKLVTPYELNAVIGPGQRRLGRLRCRPGPRAPGSAAGRRSRRSGAAGPSPDRRPLRKGSFSPQQRGEPLALRP